jgi:hypothetical protein
MPIALTVGVSGPGRSHNLLPSLEAGGAHGASFIGVNVRQGAQVVLTRPAGGSFDVDLWEELGQASFSISTELGGPARSRRMLVDVSALLGGLGPGTYEIQLEYEVSARVTLRSPWHRVSIRSGPAGPAANFYRAYQQWLLSPGFFTAPLAVDGLESLDVFGPERACLRAGWTAPSPKYARALAASYPELSLFHEVLRAKRSAKGQPAQGQVQQLHRVGGAEAESTLP